MAFGRSARKDFPRNSLNLNDVHETWLAFLSVLCDLIGHFHSLAVTYDVGTGSLACCCLFIEYTSFITITIIAELEYRFKRFVPLF